MDLKQLQKEQALWAHKNFSSLTPSWQPLMGIVEEVGELAHAHLKESQKIRTNENHIENAKDAIGDIIIFIADYCNRRNFDLTEIVEQTWSQVKKRNWKDNPEGKELPPVMYKQKMQEYKK